MADLSVDRESPEAKAILKALYARRDEHRQRAASYATTHLHDVFRAQGQHAECEWLIGQLETIQE